ncbi:MAG: BamA/TamA family outer membrane protein [Alistipes shahii]|uniref:BamA/TamA family outer membrane protein n=1 Tax=Alistipes shahii TaxID=328814 RepID=UPI00399C9E53
MLGDVTALVGRLYGGVAMAYGNSSSVPFDRQFYCGGANGMRGWTPRTLGQGSVPDPRNDYPVQTGDVKLEANSNCASRSGGSSTGRPSSIWAISGTSGRIRRSIRTMRSSASIGSTNSWDSTRDWACASTSNSPCRAPRLGHPAP